MGFIKLWPTMRNGDAHIVVEYAEESSEILTLDISEIIVYFNVDTKEGLYANTIDQAIEEYPSITQDELTKLRADLRKCHSNYVCCELSSVRSKGFTNRKTIGTITKEKTVAIYCRVKGHIPYGEKQFRRKVDEYWTDIRPAFIFAAHKEVNIGAEIKAVDINLCGTLGPFYDHPRTQLTYALSAAHCFVTPNQLCEMIKKNDHDPHKFEIRLEFSEKEMPPIEMIHCHQQDDTAMEVEESGSETEQAMDVDLDTNIGDLEKLVWLSGYDGENDGKGKAGVDISAIRVRDKNCLSGCFDGPPNPEVELEFGRYIFVQRLC